MVSSTLGIATFMFSFSVSDDVISCTRLVYLGNWHFDVPDLFFWNGLKSSAVLFTYSVYLHIYISCPALLYHYACLPCFKTPHQSQSGLQEPPWRRWGVTFGIRAEGYQTGQKFLKTFWKLFEKPFTKKHFSRKFPFKKKKAIPQRPLALSLFP